MILHRLRIYLKEMFPIHIFLPYIFLKFFNLYGLVFALTGNVPQVLKGVALTGVVTLLFIMLLMRIFDELKDLETDKKLFPERAIPRGAVLPADLRKLAISLVVVILLLNVWFGWILIPVIAMLVYAFLTFKWFFFKRQMSNNLLLALVTHQPLTLLVNFYVIALAAYQIGELFWQPELTALLFLFFFPVTAWEVSRKIRAKGKETEYVTYSKIMGSRGAAILTFTFITLTFILAVYVAAEIPFHHSFYWLTSAVYLLTAAIFARFIPSPEQKNNILLQTTQVFVMGLFLITFIYLLIKFL